MAPRYRVTLTEEERRDLEALTRSGKTNAPKFIHARALLLCDAGPHGDPWKVAEVAEALAGKATPIKSALLDQRVVAGLGNIYVCEALFRAGISPKRLAGSITKERIGPLVVAIKKVLKDAIAAGGSTLRDHAQATGDPGNFQHRFLVYGREGLPCKLKCPGTVKRLVQAGRSTFYCPKCQT